MSAIDKIMKCAYEYGCARAQEYETSDPADSRLVCAERAELRDLITAALDEARREGAEAMREAVESLREDADEIFPPTGRGRQAPVEARDVVEWYSESIRALPLPTGKRQAVRLTDEEVKQIGNATLYAGGIYDRVRAIESAVLAANGLGDAK